MKSVAVFLSAALFPIAGYCQAPKILSAADSALIAKIALAEHPGAINDVLLITRVGCGQSLHWANAASEEMATRCKWVDGNQKVTLHSGSYSVSLFHLLQKNGAHRSDPGLSIYFATAIRCNLMTPERPEAASCELMTEVPPRRSGDQNSEQNPETSR